LAAGHRISAIIRGVESARAMVAGKPDAPERSIGRGAVGWLVPIDDAGPHVGPELVVHFRAAPDQAGGKTEARVVRFLDCRVEIGDADHLKDWAENLLVGTVANIGHIDQ